MWLLILLVVVVCFGLGAVLGAPYLPTLSETSTRALDLSELVAGQRLLDLGAGSGSLMVAAARRGIVVTGIEINPLLWLWAWLRLWPYRQLATIKLGNYWRMNWPPADCIYVFLIRHQMPHLVKQLNQRIQIPTTVISFTFELPGARPRQTKNGLYVYDWPQQKA